MLSNNHSKYKYDLTTLINKEYHTIEDALNTIKASLFAFAFCEYYKINLSNIIAIEANISIYFDFQTYTQIKEKKDNNLCLLMDDSHSSIRIMPDSDFKLLSSQTILRKFPFFKEILNKKNYNDISLPVNKNLLNHCQRIQAEWKAWSREGMHHIISTLQTLMRHVSYQMIKPLFPNHENKPTNGLSLEYQCEIYAEQLYGAKLLEIWHYYLTSQQLEPYFFFHWLKSLSKTALDEFAISNLDHIPRVHYIHCPKERSQWLLQLDSTHFVKNDNLPTPTYPKQKIEIIFVLGKSESSYSQFFGGIKKRGLINHSTFFAGEKVDGAGIMLLEARKDAVGYYKWFIKKIDNNSGHIKPTDKMAFNVLKNLHILKLDLTKIIWHSTWGTSLANTEIALNSLKKLSIIYEKINLIKQFLKIKDEEFISALESHIIIINGSNVQKSLIVKLVKEVIRFLHKQSTLNKENSLASNIQNSTFNKGNSLVSNIQNLTCNNNYELLSRTQNSTCNNNYALLSSTQNSTCNNNYTSLSSTQNSTYNNNYALLSSTQYSTFRKNNSLALKQNIQQNYPIKNRASL